MSDENNDEAWEGRRQHELSETPLGGYRQDLQEEKSGVESEQVAPVKEESQEAKIEAAQGAAAGAESEEAQPQVDYSRTFRSLSAGDVVDGVVVHIDKEGVLVDVGTKSEGIIRPQELSRDANVSPEDVVQVGEHIDVYVMESETEEGNIMLSKKRADFEKAWERVEEAHRTHKTLTAMVTDRVKGGLVVDLGIRGFVPASHVAGGNVKNLDRFVGQSLPLRVIEVDRERRKVVLSHKIASEEERERRKSEALAKLREGEVRSGVVRRLTDYGAFIDLGGVDGLLHISEMSWTRIKHPSEMLKVGQKIQVMILKLDMEHERISLGLRQILPDPWADIESRYHVGDMILGTVTRLVPFGAFVQVGGGIEGILPNNELARRRVANPEEIVQVGQRVEVKVIDLKPEERRMTLSLRAAQAAREREREQKEMAEYASRTSDSRTTIGDLVGHAFATRQKEEKQAEQAEQTVSESQKQAGAAASGQESAGCPEAKAEAVAEEPGLAQQSEIIPEAPEVPEAAAPVEETVTEEAIPEPAAEAPEAGLEPGSIPPDASIEPPADVRATAEVPEESVADVEAKAQDQGGADPQVETSADQPSPEEPVHRRKRQRQESI